MIGPSRRSAATRDQQGAEGMADQGDDRGPGPIGAASPASSWPGRSSRSCLPSTSTPQRRPGPRRLIGLGKKTGSGSEPTSPAIRKAEPQIADPLHELDLGSWPRSRPAKLRSRSSRPRRSSPTPGSPTRPWRGRSMAAARKARVPWSARGEPRFRDGRPAHRPHRDLRAGDAVRVDRIPGRPHPLLPSTRRSAAAHSAEFASR